MNRLSSGPLISPVKRTALVDQGIHNHERVRLRGLDVPFVPHRVALAVRTYELDTAVSVAT